MKSHLLASAADRGTMVNGCPVTETVRLIEPEDRDPPILIADVRAASGVRPSKNRAYR